MLSFNFVKFTNMDKLINMRRTIARAFSTGKYFLDDKFQNVSIESSNKLGSLHDLCSLFTNEGVNMSFIKSHFSNAWTQNKKYCLDISIDKQSP